MKKLLICLLCVLPMHAGATVLYRVQKTGMPNDSVVNNDAFASRHRFYVGGMYDLSFWGKETGDGVTFDGKTSSGFDVVAGFRIYDTFRVEADYMNTRAKWDEFALKTNTVFVNALVDARLDNIYRFFYKQKLVPYVGAGVGMTWVDGDGTDVKNDTVSSMAALAGFAVELGEHVALDLGYRYVYMFKPRAEILPDLRPRAHQLRAGIRINF
ncbi:MAG: porin family protein [Alphaproteobacteria bacterium]|nr:porin family protein [Alphaproteobacteria bacterium]